MIDLAVSAWFHAHLHPTLTQLMLVLAHWHSTPGLLAMTALLGWALQRAGRSWWLLALVLSVPGVMLLNVGVKHLVQRARPQFDDPVLVLTTYSFPSGHTAGATVFYGFLAAYLATRPRAKRWQGWIVAVAAGMILLVGVSRIYLGVHYLTDVIAGMVEGVLWLALCLSGVRALRRRREDPTA